MRFFREFVDTAKKFFCGTPGSEAPLEKEADREKRRDQAEDNLLRLGREWTEKGPAFAISVMAILISVGLSVMAEIGRSISSAGAFVWGLFILAFAAVIFSVIVVWGMSEKAKQAGQNRAKWQEVIYVCDREERSELMSLLERLTKDAES